MRKGNFALRLQPSLMEEGRRVAQAEGVAVNQLINVAVAEKVSALRTEEYFAERAARGNISNALRILKRPGLATRLWRATISRPRVKLRGRSVAVRPVVAAKAKARGRQDGAPPST